MIIAAIWYLRGREVSENYFASRELQFLVSEDGKHFRGGTDFQKYKAGDYIEFGFSLKNKNQSNRNWDHIVDLYNSGELRPPDYGIDPRRPKEPPKPINRFAFIEEEL